METRRKQVHTTRIRNHQRNTIPRKPSGERSTMTTRKSNPQRVEPPYLALMSAGRTTQNAKRKTDDEKQQNKPYLQRYTPEEKELRLKTSQRGTQEIWEKLTHRKPVNDIPTRQYATWARFYRIAYETGTIKR